MLATKPTPLTLFDEAIESVEVLDENDDLCDRSDVVERERVISASIAPVQLASADNEAYS
jgi:hypothetical protein